MKLRGVFKQLGAVDIQPNEKKLHLYLIAGSSDSLSRTILILRHHSSTGILLANPQPMPMYAPIHVQPPPVVSPYYMPQQLLQHPNQTLATQQALLHLQLQHQHQHQQFPLQYPPQPQFLWTAPLNLEQHRIYRARVALAGLAVGYPGFSVKAKIIGPHGQNLKHILAVTGAEVHLSGQGTDTFPKVDESESLYLELSAPSQQSLNEAVVLASNLVETVRQEYVAFVTKPLPNYATKALPSTQEAHIFNSQHAVAADSSLSLSSGRATALRGVPDPVFQNPQPHFHSSAPLNLQSTLNAKPRAYYDAPTITSANPVQSGRCVPFIYSDGDGVVRPPTPHNDDTHLPASAAPLKPLLSVEGSGRPGPALLSLNGSTFVAKVIVKDEDRVKKQSSHDNRQSSSSSSSGGGKRRRGFQESSVYTAPIDCPLPVVTVLESSAPPPLSEHVSPSEDTARTRKRTAGNSALDEIVIPSATDCSAIGVDLPKHATERCSVPEVSDPTPSVMAALAAMTERRLQTRILRPLVPSFSNSDSQPAKSLPGKHSPQPFAGVTESLTSSTASSTSSALNAHGNAPPAALCVKLPGLSAYEDDEDD